VEAAYSHAGSTQRRTLDRAAESARNPVNFAAAVRDGAAALETLGLTENGAAVLAAAGATAARDIEVADTPDVCSLMMRVDSAGGEWRSVLDVSPGERATAALALALAGGNAPLVIDQPEDDLDNRYIYDEVVRLVTEVCEGRQVIVATHNANIPVLGDAECVLAFQATHDRAEVLACGGLEDRSVTEVARHVLEGGEQAFRERHRRYTRGSA
jgi:ABC-type taurine transport system ATPase subunit